MFGINTWQGGKRVARKNAIKQGKGSLEAVSRGTRSPVGSRVNGHYQCKTR